MALGGELFLMSKVPLYRRVMCLGPLGGAGGVALSNKRDAPVHVQGSRLQPLGWGSVGGGGGSMILRFAARTGLFLVE